MKETLKRFPIVAALCIALALPTAASAQLRTLEAKKDVYETALAGNFADALSMLSAFAAKDPRPQLWEAERRILRDTVSGQVTAEQANAFFEAGTELLLRAPKPNARAVRTKIDALVRMKPDYAPFQSFKGSALQALGRKAAAVTAFARAIELEPSEAWYHHNRALALGRRSIAKALAGYEEALALAPKWAFVFLSNRGRLHTSLRRYDAALADFAAAIEARKENADAYYNRGNLWARQKKLEKAISDYTQAIRYDPQFLQALTNRGVARRRLGRLAQSVEDHSAALEINPRHTTALMGRAFAYSGLKKRQLALEDIRRAAKLAPNNYRMHLSHAMMASRAGRIREEIAALKRVMRTAPPSQGRRKAATRRRIQQLERSLSGPGGRP